jgi:Putative peptidoglycan binding domain
MRTLIILICSLTLVLFNTSAQESQATKEKKKAATTRQAQPAKAAAGKPAQVGKPVGPPGRPAEVRKAKGTAKPTQVAKPTEPGKPKGPAQATTAGKPTEVGKPKGPGKPTPTGKAAGAGKVAGAPKPTPGGKRGATGVAAGKPLKPQHFNLPKQPNTAKAPAMKFQQSKRIEGSQNWQGQQYTVFRNYRSEWHDENWWHSHHNRIVFVFDAPYFWNAGYWFPYYAWDGPIYAYNNLPPDQVIANVQAVLQQQGYYHGEVDGLLGPLTRAALADYQRDHGLYTTSTIDQPTLQSLGMA